MARCDSCGNHCDDALEIRASGRVYTFDCFACAIHHLANWCESCGCRILARSITADGRTFCGERCLRKAASQVA